MAVAVTVVGSTAYVADANAGLVLVDVSTPASPVVLAKLSLPGEASGLHVVDSLAYVACGFGGLSVVDVRDPRPRSGGPASSRRVLEIPSMWWDRSLTWPQARRFVGRGREPTGSPDLRGATPPQFGRNIWSDGDRKHRPGLRSLIGVLAVDVSRPENRSRWVRPRPWRNRMHFSGGWTALHR